MNVSLLGLLRKEEAMVNAAQEHVLNLLFGSNGISESTDEELQDDRIAVILQHVCQHNIDAVDYLEKRIIPKIYNNNTLKWAEQWISHPQ